MSNFHTQPWAPYQLSDFERTVGWKTAAIFWEQGLGKTWLAINTLRAWHERGAVDACIVTAPNGVHANWPEQLALHLPPDYPYEVMVWWGSEARKYWRKGVQENVREFVDQKDKLIILCVSYHAFLQKHSLRVLTQFLQERRCAWFLDESDDISNPTGKWSRKIIRLSQRSVIRRILTGTPYKDGTPLAYYSQFEFLHPAILGPMTWRQFRLRYAIWYFKKLPGRPYDAMIPVKDEKTGRQKFRNLDELRAKMAVRTVIRTKDEELQHLPKKAFEKLVVEFSEKQASVYEQLRDEAILQLPPGGEENQRIIDQAMLLRLRLQQIACGFYPSDGEEPERRIEGALPRLERTIEEALRAPGQVIIWARFVMDITNILWALTASGTTEAAVRYDGQVKDTQRERHKQMFLSGEVKFFVANPAVASRGFTFTNSHRAFYYSNHDKFLLRVQSEDRQHRIGTTNAVLYTDVVARDSVDESILKALRSKMDVAAYLSGRPRREWI